MPKLPVPKKWSSWFAVENPTAIAFIQDVVHIAVKLKSSIKPSTLGKYIAGIHHLYLVQHTFGKDQHGIRMKDIDHKDTQNYDAVLHITSDSVLTLLSHIPDARGKVAFLNVIRCVIDSFLDKKLDALSRIDKAWYAVFFSRYWRQWLLLNSHYTLGRNFITANAYKCIELNAHSLITFLMTVRDSFHPDCQSFIPWMLGSQSCEKYEHHVFYHHKLEHAWSFTKTQFCLEAQSEETGIKYPHKEAHEKKDGHHKATICHVFSVDK